MKILISILFTASINLVVVASDVMVNVLFI